ncbi:translocation/assembly module TamB domain-containing protein [Geobacter sp. DSM 9736]|uniref:translocation/assembly module TamB domain-containing protein n=1 Tax=Geobacter sp. DSM 9736 TaxID=1277350 RepID=UPI000B50E2C5|nr:translocation/assembly module TamB domain-containing protein [Geobacter sp. DSM 9736]SNB46795.1 translocation and assembly module TamB [Geobacter sp. DSM 9736]
MRKIAIAIAAGLLLTMILLAGIVVWLGGSSSGTQTIFRIISRYSPVKVSTKEVEGKLLGPLHLAGLRIELPHTRLEAARLHLDWYPHALLNGRVLVKELVLEGVHVHDLSPPSGKPPAIGWPRVSGILLRTEVRVEQLRVTDLIYRSRDAKPIRLTSLTGSAAWNDGTLSLYGLQASAPEGSVSGNVAAGFRFPSLRADLAILPAVKTAIETISVRLRLIPGKSPEFIGGRISINGKGAKTGPFAVKGELALTRTEIRLRRIIAQRTGKSGKVTGTATVTLRKEGPHYTAHLQTEKLDLFSETGRHTDLSGRLTFSGTPSAYVGSVALQNRGEAWRLAALSSPFRGNDRGITLAPLSGTFLSGTISGSLSIGWHEEIRLRSSVKAMNLNPSIVDRRWQGEVSFEADAAISSVSGKEMSGEVTGTFLPSTLHGRPLTGKLDARFSGKRVTIRELFVKGEGFSATASGDLTKRLSFIADADDLRLVAPGVAGQASAQGWVRWSGTLPAGEIVVQGENLSAGGAGIAQARLVARAGTDRSDSATGRLWLQGVDWQHISADAATLDFDGSIAAHTVSIEMTAPQASLWMSVRGGYHNEAWQGEITALSGKDPLGAWKMLGPAPLDISRERLALSSLNVVSAGGERVTASAGFSRKPLGGSLRAEWNSILLDRANPWLEGVQLHGDSSGEVDLRLTSRRLVTGTGQALLAGTVAADGKAVQVRNAFVRLDLEEEGMSGLAELDLGTNGHGSARFASHLPPRLGIPQEGKGDVQWDIDMALLQPWLPENFDMTGRLAGRVTTTLHPGSRFEMIGKTTLSSGSVQVAASGGRLATRIRTLDAAWGWKGSELEGGFTASLSQWGETRGQVRLPIPARFPLEIDRTRSLLGYITGEVRELGVITALFPGIVQEGHGTLGYDLRAEGSWNAPKLLGTAQLKGGSAYIPSAGIRVSGTEVYARFDRERVVVEKFRAASGPGFLEGAGEIRLGKGQVADYRFTLSGERFQAVNLPGMSGTVTPRLEISGTPARAAVTGNVLIPDLRITGETTGSPVEPSSDVVILDAPPNEQSGRTSVALRVGIRLGDRVIVKAKGIDARLEGGLDLTGEDLERISSRGEIKVVEGRYKAYGLDLEIVRGRIFYAGGPLAQPTLDILALRTLEDVKAGVTVAGSVAAPVVKLYSEPAMPDVDILAYMVLGHPLGQSSGEQAGLVSRAAAALLSAGQSVALQDQVKSRLGLSTIEIQTGEQQKGYMGGYRRVAVAPPGSAPAEAGAISDTTVLLGKYLTPRLYVSYGRSLFTGTNIFRLRYDISRKWQIETQAGAESGADLFYKIDFD